MQLHGTGVGHGVAVGVVLTMPPSSAEPARVMHAGDTAAEVARVDAARASVAADLTALGARVGGQARVMIDATAMMVLDPSLTEEIRARVEAGIGGERAVFEAVTLFRDGLVRVGGLIAERATDLDDACHRIIARLRGLPTPGIPTSDRPFILIAADLAPADTATLDPRSVLAIVTRDGGPTSHTAILARSRSIPAVVGVAEVLSLVDGTWVIVDAAAGVVTTDPDAAALSAARLRARPPAHEIGLPDKTPMGGPRVGALADGRRVRLFANVNSVDDASRAIVAGAEGIGLLRTEFLFPGYRIAPSIADQQRRYEQYLSLFRGRPVVVRVFDAGSDKPLAFLTGRDAMVTDTMTAGETWAGDRLPAGGSTSAIVEPNPALGVRGLRALMAREQVLIDQLTALAAAAASTGAELWTMAPMVADAAEAAYFIDLARSLGLETVGVNVEVPSLALMAGEALAAADFISIGTNDLTQYTLAADRMLAGVARYQDPWHPAVLRLVRMMGDAGSDAGKPVGVCGEAAADPDLAVVLVGLGATSLSMAPSAIAEVRDALAMVTFDEAIARADAAATAATAADARVAAARAAAAAG